MLTNSRTHPGETRGMLVEPDAWIMHQETLRAASAKERDRWHAETREALNDVARVEAVYGSSLTSDDVARQARMVCEMACQMLQAPSAQVTIMGTDAQIHIARYHTTPAPRHEQAAPIPAEEGFCKFVIGTAKPFAVSDATDHALVCDLQMVRDGSCVSYLGVPVLNSDEAIVGTLCCWAPDARNWDVTDVDMLTRLARILMRADARSKHAARRDA